VYIKVINASTNKKVKPLLRIPEEALKNGITFASYGNEIKLKRPRNEDTTVQVL